MALRPDDFFTALDAFDRVPLDALVERLEALEITLDDVASHVSFSPERYQRNMVRLGAGYEALVLCWLPGQRSPIHDHRGSACGLRILQGTATEVRYRRGPDGMLSESGTSEYPSGLVCGSEDADIHELSNRSTTENLVTLHVYAPAMLRCSVYRLDSPEVGEWVDPKAAQVEAMLAAMSAP